MTPPRIPGPQCRYHLVPEIDHGTLCRDTSPRPGLLSGFSLWPELHSPDVKPSPRGLDGDITAADIAEFKVIKKMPVYDSARHPYRHVNRYVADRTRYFGATSIYTAFAAESDAELANTKWVGKIKTRTLASMIEFNHKHQVEQQRIFYRWVRKAYKRKYGDDVNVPEMIRKGMSQELADQVAAVRGSIRVKNIHDEKFHAGGFNPRPIKFAHHYLLGTLSEHATGMAVDIDDKQNAQLTANEWKFIETFVGKQVVRSGRWGTEAAAELLWKDIKEVNDLFVKKVASEVARIAKAGAPAASHSAGAPKGATPLEQVLGDHYKSLSTWATSGFFHLPLELVLELHAHGFTWGATFKTNVDLHHFELDR